MKEFSLNFLLAFTTLFLVFISYILFDFISSHTIIFLFFGTSIVSLGILFYNVLEQKNKSKDTEILIGDLKRQIANLNRSVSSKGAEVYRVNEKAKKYEIAANNKFTAEFVEEKLKENSFRYYQNYENKLSKKDNQIFELSQKLKASEEKIKSLETIIIKGRNKSRHLKDVISNLKQNK